MESPLADHAREIFLSCDVGEEGGAMSGPEDLVIRAAIELAASFEGFADMDRTGFLDQAVVSRRAMTKLQDAVLAYARNPNVRLPITPTEHYVCPNCGRVDDAESDKPEFDGHCPKCTEQVMVSEEKTNRRHRWPGYVVGEYEEP